MKENPVVDGANDSTKPTQRGTSPRGKAQRRPSVEVADFSPEKIQAQASNKSTVLIKMLEREETTYYSRHWGINE
jgi:hypothetical protein